ncbi:eukaryotic translation initiation factor 4E1 isoform X1 [Amyelois transitella]|uniref:eukaryotic translation initiation factor 4E1 isoform X1 n=1 Tax=Amyelois transitella TaxID=680683 RepID=UPI00298F90B2|nr:eukaryotic translation initiation factor 4E1 isoform X1 [Amyelois transitella]
MDKKSGNQQSKNEATTNVEEVTTKAEVMTTEPSERCKHPLENTWSFWLQANNKKEWKDNLVELTSFDTVEDYWCLYHYMKLPSELTLGQDYAVFKKGIEPTWEDKENRQGGRWMIMVEKGNYEKLDRIWLDTVLMVIGENFGDQNESITGVVVNVKAYSKIGVWTKNHADKNTVMRIGHTLKSVLRIRRLIEYMPHNTSKIIYSI